MDDGGISAARLGLCESINNVLEITVGDFMSYYMPPSPVQVELLVDKLAQPSRVVGKQGFTHRPPLSSFPTTPHKWAALTKTPEARADSGEYEIEVFADLENITAQIVKCCQEIAPQLRPSNKLRSNGTKPLLGHIYTSAQPDGIRVLDGMKPSWVSVAVTEEYTLRPGDALDNYQKIVWNMHQTMRSDYTRCFVFGVTIHNTSVRLWHMNRELLLVSNIFDMNQDCSVFADMHARFAFASRDDLGYDHTMTKLHPDLQCVTGKLAINRSISFC